MKNIWKKLVGLAVGIALITGVAGCGSNASNNSVKKSEKVNGYKKIRIGCVGQGNVLVGAIGVSDSLGYLKEELEKVGYEPEIVGFAQAGPAINEAFAAKNLDVAMYGDLPATVAKANGTDTTIFATYDSQMQMGLFVRKGVKDIKSAKDLPGHKVIVARGTIYHQYFKSLIKAAGVKESDIDQINTYSDASSLIASGDADALVTFSSTAYYLESKGYGSIVEDTTSHPEWTSQFFGVGLTDYLKENKEAVKAIIKAMFRGQEYVKKNTQKAYEIWAKKQKGYTPKIYKKEYAYDTSFDYFSPEITDESIQKLERLDKFLEDEKLISHTVDMKKFVDKSYYEEAKAEYDEDK